MDSLKNKQVGIWLLIGVAMILFQIVLGGITRLTGSGLSITEWQPILGVLPPMNLEDWNKAFDAYKKFPQYELVNQSMTLSQFKTIFFWEYLHRSIYLLSCKTLHFLKRNTKISACIYFGRITSCCWMDNGGEWFG